MAEASDPFIHAEYVGTGELVLDEAFPCEFSVIQHNSGSITVSLLLTGAFPGADFSLPNPSRLEGKIDGGHQVLASGGLQLLNKDLAQQKLEFWARWVDVTLAEEPPDELRFDVVNLTQTKRVQFEFPVDGSTAEFVFEPHGEIASRRRRLGRHQQQEILGQLSVDLFALDAKIAYSSASLLCQLVSIGAGTWVNFIVVKRYVEGKLVGKRHEERITAPYCAWRPLDLRDPRAMPDFVKATARSFQKVYEPFQFGKGIVQTFVNSRLETGPLEVRGVNVVGHLELLMDRFVAQHPEVNTVIDFSERTELEKKISKKFDKIRRSSRKSVFRMLTNNGFDTGDAKKAAFELARGIKLDFFNRTSFKEKLIAFRARYQVPLSDDELGKLVRHRNHLIHTGGFAPPSNEEEYSEEPDDRWQLKAYVFLLSVIDRIILSLLEYRGPCLDWRDFPPQPNFFPDGMRDE